MSNQTENTWPFTVAFANGGRELTFETPDAIRKWASREFNGWSSLANNSQITSQKYSENLNRVRSLLEVGDDGARKRLLSIAESYFTWDGPLATILRGLQNPTRAAVALQEALEPGQSRWNITLDTVAGVAAATVYRSVGADIGALDRVQATFEAVNQSLREVREVRSGDREVLDRFYQLMSQTEEDWKNKIDGYEAKMALKAPKAYWTDRASNHAAKAVSARRQWFWALVAVSITTSALVVYILLSLPSEGVIVEAIRAAQRILVLGTLLAFIVWWLRQKLRDLRAHEHLAEDAAERVTMIETYAAMRAAGLQDANLGTVLTALYRPAMGGFSEDSGPVLPLEILLKSVGGTLGKKD
jgi:hypothetical protein